MVAGADGGDVGRDRLGDLGDAQPELGEPLLGGAATRLRPLEVGDEVLRVHARHDLHELPAVLAEVVEDLLGRVHQHRRGEVLPLVVMLMRLTLGHGRMPWPRSVGLRVGRYGAPVARAPSEDVLTRPARCPTRCVRYAAHEDGVVDVHLPPGGRARAPLVVLVHGGFWKQAYDRCHSRPMACALPPTGWVVAMPEYRRVGGPAGGWPATAQDVAAAVAALPSLLGGLGVRTAPDPRRPFRRGPPGALAGRPSRARRPGGGARSGRRPAGRRPRRARRRRHPGAARRLARARCPTPTPPRTRWRGSSTRTRARDPRAARRRRRRRTGAAQPRARRAASAGRPSRPGAPSTSS